MLPFPLYLNEDFDVPSIDSSGTKKVIRTRVFSPEAVRLRRPFTLMKELDRQHLVKRKRLGNSRIMCVAALDAIESTNQMTRAGKLFYDVP